MALSLSPELGEARRVIAESRPDIIHIGAAVELFSVADTRALKAEFPWVLVMRSIPIVDITSTEWARSYQGVADFLLLDSHDPGDRPHARLGGQPTHCR